MNKGELVEKVAARADLSRASAQSVLDAVLGTIADALKDGKPVTLTGFGTFDVNARPARDARNPRTGETVRVPATMVVKFRPGKGLKDTVQ
jgi:DNA-binding protein HU-beta